MPRSKVKSITRGKAATLTGVKELAANVRDLKDIVAGHKAQGVIADATDVVYKEVVSRAKSVRVPHDVLTDIFTYKKPPPNPSRREVSCLVGVRKRGYRKPWAAAYREWNPGGSWGAVTGGYLKRKGADVLKKGLVTGRKIGESLATMWEIGTSRMQAKPFFRPALMAARQAALMVMANGFRRIIKKYAA